MDNPHAFNRSAYLAGVIDGDGGVKLYRLETPHNNSMRPSITIMNTNQSIINYCSDSLNDLGIRYHYSISARPKRKPLHRLSVVSHPNCARLIDEVYDHLIINKKRASIVRRFIDYRKTTGKLYGKYEISLYSEFDLIRECNGEQVVDVHPSYIGGMIDTEGTVMLTYNPKLGKLSAKVEISNASLPVVQTSGNMFESLGVSPYYASLTTDRGTPFYRVAANGVAKSNKVLTGLKNHIIGKADQVALVLEYTDIRIGLNKAGIHKAKHTPYEIELANRVRALNR